MDILANPEVELDDEPDYKAPVVHGRVYTLGSVSFSDCLCEVPEEIYVLDTGQTIAKYSKYTRGDNGGDTVAPVPAVPYDTLLECLEDHAQGTLKADELRARMVRKDAIVSFTRAQLQEFKKHAERFWGTFAIKFTPKLHDEAGAPRQRPGKDPLWKVR